MPNSVGLVPGSAFPGGLPAGASRAAAAGITSSLVVGTIVLLIVLVVVAMLLVITFGHLSWRARGKRPMRRRLARNQREAAAAVAELREGDDYAADSPRLDEDEL